MVDQSAAQTAGPAHCPWCSAELPSDATDNCPSCGATLVGEAEAALPGVTAIDPEAIVRNARMPTAPRRSRLLSWFGGEDTTPDEAPPNPGSLAPPPPEVRREILRLELEAEVANLQAEADSIVAEAAVDAGEDSIPSVGVDISDAAAETDGSFPAAANPAPAATHEPDVSTDGSAPAGASTSEASPSEASPTEDESKPDPDETTEGTNAPA
jgi:hypothetical protein